jgi:murein DD-endopeptidase MepM/ murein hydrolase activator NlpD
MSDATQTLFEFIQNLKTDLDSEAISAHEAIVAGSQYSYLRDAFSAQAESLTSAAIQGDDALKTLLLTIINNAQSSIVAAQSFQSQNPDIPQTEREIKTVSSLREFSLRRARNNTNAKLTTQNTRKQTFVRDLVTRFSARYPQGITQAQLENVLNPALALSSSAPNSTAAIEVVKNVLSDKLSGSNKNELAQIEQIVQGAITSSGVDYIQSTHDIRKKEYEIYKTVVMDIEIKRPDVFVDVLINAPENEKREASIARAQKLAGAAYEIQQTTKNGFGRQGKFFTSDNANGINKGIQQAADSMLSLVGEPFREIILKNKTEGTLRNLLTNTQQTIDRLGESFVRSPLFVQVSQNIAKSVGEKPAPRGSSVVGDIFTSIFRGPLDPAIAEGAKEKIFNYFELARANAAAPENLQFLPAVGFGPWNVSGGASKPTYIRRAYIPTIGFGASIGDFFASGVDRTISTIFANPYMGPQMSSARRRSALPTPFAQDLPLQISIVVIVSIVVIAAFTYLSHAYKNVSLLTSLQQKIAVTLDTVVDKTSFACSWNGPTPPISTISTCPVRAPITQGPFSQTGSHKYLNAYDFGASQGEPIVAAHDGYVASYDNFYAPNQFKNLSYGNNVVMIATNPTSGKQYCTNYAHLLDVSPIVITSKGAPVLIRAGTVIGYADTTGYTYGYRGLGTGTHLHFGYKGENQTTPITLPPGCP